MLRLGSLAADRIEGGIATLADDAEALDAFRVANRAVARALKKRLDIDTPRWRAFQLAFVLLNLPGMVDPSDPNRETVDLLFFPTGGGKTEAYLGLAAFAMVLRRLRHPGEQALGGAGVSVIMRYTLRLLTLDQLARAAGLVCALELERGGAPSRYGVWPFGIGLWVGKAATPNVLGYKGYKGSGDARSKVRQFKNDPDRKPSPIPLENCPWCGERFQPESFTLLPNDDQPRELRIVCTNFECDFTRDRPLPIVAVDQPIYRRLPAFLIATVDKFAALPWVAEAGALLGGADRHDASGFYGAGEPGQGSRLEAPLPPPDLVIKQRVDCAIATNMISVGLDIPRLGLMMVLGQPKTHAEYIQATSRVGRYDQRPGLVVTLLSIHKPRDRSHYERFRHYHETFYRSVEVGSVTPFSARALDRGFAGALVGLARHIQPELTPPRGAEHIADVRAELEHRLLETFLERVSHQPLADEAERDERLRSVQNRVVDLLDSWRKIFDDYHAAGVDMQYQKYELKQPRPLLRDMLDTEFESEHHRKFRANRSLRDVEPEVNLFPKDLSGIQVGDGT